MLLAVRNLLSRTAVSSLISPFGVLLLQGSVGFNELSDKADLLQVEDFRDCHCGLANVSGLK